MSHFSWWKYKLFLRVGNVFFLRELNGVQVYFVNFVNFSQLFLSVFVCSSFVSHNFCLVASMLPILLFTLHFCNWASCKSSTLLIPRILVKYLQFRQKRRIKEYYGIYYCSWHTILVLGDNTYILTLLVKI